MIRLALYSPGMVGLGHVRRNLLVAHGLRSAQPGAPILLIAETREAGALPMPHGVDCVTLPGIMKQADGRCDPRRLALPLAEVVALRAQVITAALRAFEPDVLVVDHLPFGAGHELAPALESLRLRGRTRCVLGLRDVLEAPDVVRREWPQRRYQEAFDRYYDAAWIFGDPAVYNPITEYALPWSIASKVRFAGYLQSQARLDCLPARGRAVIESLNLSGTRYALCLVGAGSDGAPLADAFLRARLPDDMAAVAVLGPFMPDAARRALHELAARRPTHRVLDFVHEPAPLVQHATAVVAMGGYSSVADVLSFDRPALIVPRAGARSEQWIRAERLRARGLVDVLPPDALSVARLGDWIAAVDRVPRAARQPVDMSGLTRIPALLDELIGEAAARSDLREAAER